MAIANEKVSRPQPWPNDIGVRNWPSAERGPKAINARAQPTEINTAGVRQDASFNGAGAGVDDMGPPNFLRQIRREVERILRHSVPQAKAKVRDGIDLRASWLHGCAAIGDWRDLRRSAI